MGTIPIPSTSRDDRMDENLRSFDFDLEKKILKSFILILRKCHLKNFVVVRDILELMF